jgi:hypothetical protein
VKNVPFAFRSNVLSKCSSVASSSGASSPQARRAIVFDHLGAFAHRCQQHRRLDRFLPQPAVARIRRGEQRQGRLAQALHVPQTGATARAQRAKPVGIADPVERTAAGTRAAAAIAARSRSRTASRG